MTGDSYRADLRISLISMPIRIRPTLACEDELAAALSHSEINLVSFVALGEVEPQVLECSLYLLPDRIGGKALEVFTRAMMSAGLDGIGEWHDESRTVNRTIIVSAQSGTLAMYFLRATPIMSPNELDLARDLIKNMQGPLSPELKRLVNNVRPRTYGESPRRRDRTQRQLVAHGESKPKPTDLISQAKAAELASCSDKTIGRRIADGILTAYGAKGARKVSQDEVLAKRDAIRERIPRKSMRT